MVYRTPDKPEDFDGRPAECAQIPLIEGGWFDRYHAKEYELTGWNYWRWLFAGNRKNIPEIIALTRHKLWVCYFPNHGWQRMSTADALSWLSSHGFRVCFGEEV